MTNHWIDLKNSDVILVIGGNPAECHPASLLQIMSACFIAFSKIMHSHH
jgi:formate dehydrogenase major subunit